jgi:radical SAM superfamily enzyme YgiQ (UPF0313 family)
VDRIRAVNPRAHLCAYGLYAPLNERLLRGAGVGTILGGEFEAGLRDLARRLSNDTRGPVEQPATISRDRQQFLVPDRQGLPPLGAYAQLVVKDGTRRVGYTEASRGCRYLCRHCPVVPVYRGTFRIVQRDIVLEDIRRQVAAGAAHITFGDPDFFNGPKHAIDLVRAVHAEFPEVTYDATIKIEHLLKQRDLLETLRETGCVMITSAVESLDDAVLEKLRKNHTRADFLEAVELTRQVGLTLRPTFIAFTPWTTLESYRDLLRVIRDLDLVDHVAPVQLALRLLITPGSRLLELDEIRRLVGPLDPVSLVYPWVHEDPEIDDLSRFIFHIAHAHTKRGQREQFMEIWRATQDEPLQENFALLPRAAIPYLDEPWYC